MNLLKTCTASREIPGYNPITGKMQIPHWIGSRVKCVLCNKLVLTTSEGLLRRHKGNEFFKESEW